MWARPTSRAILKWSSTPVMTVGSTKYPSVPFCLPPETHSALPGSATLRHARPRTLPSPGAMPHLSRSWRPPAHPSGCSSGPAVSRPGRMPVNGAERGPSTCCCAEEGFFRGLTLSNWTLLTTGPCSVDCSQGSPTRLLDASSAAFFTNSS